MAERLTKQELSLLDHIPESIRRSQLFDKLLSRAAAEIRELWEALERYGEHEVTCALRGYEAYDPAMGFKYSGEWLKQPPTCSCGFDDVLEGGK